MCLRLFSKEDAVHMIIEQYKSRGLHLIEKTIIECLHKQDEAKQQLRVQKRDILDTLARVTSSLDDMEANMQAQNSLSTVLEATCKRRDHALHWLNQGMQLCNDAGAVDGRGGDAPTQSS